MTINMSEFTNASAMRGTQGKKDTLTINHGVSTLGRMVHEELGEPNRIHVYIDDEKGRVLITAADPSTSNRMNSYTVNAGCQFGCVALVKFAHERGVLRVPLHAQFIDEGALFTIPEHEDES